ncbi:MAG: lasso peptide biosynthesis B2 protein [Erythrobacter sp.]
MNLAQSSYVPAQGEKPGLKDLGWLTTYAVRGLVELVRARAIFARLEAKEIPTRNRAVKQRATRNAAPATLARISYVVPRISHRLPWRSDCLVQAIAAQNWLAANGAASEIQIGVERPAEGKFGAHAWLVAEGEIVTGGEIERYHVLLADSASKPDSPGRNADRDPD